MCDPAHFVPPSCTPRVGRPLNAVCPWCGVPGQEGKASSHLLQCACVRGSTLCRLQLWATFHLTHVHTMVNENQTVEKNTLATFSWSVGAVPPSLVCRSHTRWSEAFHSTSRPRLWFLSGTGGHGQEASQTKYRDKREKSISAIHAK